jgi:hypothetical protein
MWLGASLRALYLGVIAYMLRITGMWLGASLRAL